MVVSLLLTIFSTGAVKPVLAQQSATLTWTGPLACPSSTGCAGGQRLSVLFYFPLQGLDTAQASNVKVCLFAPGSWINPSYNNAASVSPKGLNSGTAYTLDAGAPTCNSIANRPAGMSAVVEATASLTADSGSDALNLGFRLAPGSSGIGGVTAVALVTTTSGTNPQVASSGSPIQAYAPGAITTAYVANDAAGCGFLQPCYINSGDDLANGLGTGLKDAVDAISEGTAATPSTISIIGTYTVKGSAVLVNKAVKITGQSTSSVMTYNDLKNCSQPMLTLADAVTLTGLTINDGGCTGPHRNLVNISSSQPVTVTNSTLTGGADAIVINETTTGDVFVRFNQLTGNAVAAVSYLGDGTKGGRLYVTANNLTKVQCAASGTGATAALRVANHNYWTAGFPDPAATRCGLNANKRLGLPIAPAAKGPGVNAVLANVTETKTGVFNDQVMFNHHASEADFPLYVVDHGFMTQPGPPFSAGRNFVSPIPCSNYWDVFLDESSTTSANANLDLYIRYGRGSSDQCISTIGSAKYCDQPSSSLDKSLYPLYWLDPSGAAGTGWLTTGRAGGQPTTCDLGNKQILVSINKDGRPNLTDDLGYTPLMVGVPVLNYFSAAASSSIVTVKWATNVEPNISGFYLLRGPDGSHLSPITGLIAAKGDLNTGAYYPAYIDANRPNGEAFSYQLQIVRTDGSVFYSNLVNLVGTNATATVTLTPTKTPVTPSRTPLPSSTPRPTSIPTARPTLAYTPYRSSTPRTVTPTMTYPAFATLTETIDPNMPGADETLTALATLNGTSDGVNVEGTGTAIAMLTTVTPSPTMSLTPPQAVLAASSSSKSWLSLLFGILAGLAAMGSVAGVWYYLRLKK